MYSSLAAMITDILSIIDHLIKERIAELSPLSFCDITFIEVKRTSERSGFFAGDLVVCKICHTNIISLFQLEDLHSYLLMLPQLSYSLDSMP